MPATALRHESPESAAPSNGARLVSVDGRTLPLLGTQLDVNARGGIARATLRQTFRNPHDEPLHVTYLLPLPADGAVSGFAFVLGDERVVGEVDTKRRARERFEDAILTGRTAALLDQERTSLFTQEVGNVPPRSDVVCEVQVDQKLAWLADGAWEWRFPTVVAPRYQGAAGRVVDAARLTVDVAESSLPVTTALSLVIGDRLPIGVRPESPSHSLHTELGAEQLKVVFADDRGAALDRDVVVRWKVAGAQVGTTLDVARPRNGTTAAHAYGLLTIVPPTPGAAQRAVARDLIVLLDTSGSMSGAPLDQARRVVSSLVDSLTDADQLEIIEFSNEPRRWKKGAVKATAANRKDALAWLAKLRASSSTEMHTAILEALSPLRSGSQRQVLLVTDGLIGFEDEVIAAIAHKLPAASRVHVVGIGSGVNRTLTQSASRAGRGVELLLAVGEDPSLGCRRLVARTDRPLVTEVEVSGSALAATAPARLPDLFGGAPALVSLQLHPNGGTLHVRGRTADGVFESTLQVGAIEAGTGNQGVVALFARESVEDLELGIAAGDARGEAERVIERIGLDFQVSTRLTSWVAVSDRPTVDPRAPHRQETMPHELPFGMSAEGVGLRAASMPAPMAVSMVMPMAPARARTMAMPSMSSAGGFAGAPPAPPPPPAAAPKAYKAESVMRDEGGAREEADEAESFAPPAPEPRKKKASLADLARGLFGSKEKAASTKGGAPVRRIKARLVRRGNGRFVLEFTVAGGALDWKPGASVTVTLADGHEVIVPVDATLGTAPGTYSNGLVVTLVVTLVDGAAAPKAVSVAGSAETVVLEVA